MGKEKVNTLGRKDTYVRKQLKAEGIKKKKQENVALKRITDAATDGFSIVLAIRFRCKIHDYSIKYYESVAEEYDIAARTSNSQRNKAYYAKKANECRAYSHVEEVEKKKLIAMEQEFRQEIWDTLIAEYDQDYVGVFIDTFLYHSSAKKIAEKRNMSPVQVKKMARTMREELLYEPRNKMGL